MGIYSQFKTITGPIIVKFQPNEDGSIPTFKMERVKRFNTKWNRIFEEETAPYKAAIDDKSIDPETEKMIFIRIFIKASNLSWSSIRDAHEKNIEFSVEAATDLFLDLPELYDKLVEKAETFENFLAANVEGASKN